MASALTGSVAADGQTPMTGALNMANNQITALADPTLSQDAATKAYVDASVPTLSNFLTKANNLSDVASPTTSRTNIGAAASGANSDITSITGLTTPLTVAQGGIGAATLTANNVLLGNGTSAPQTVAPGTSGNVLTSNGTTWSSSAPTSPYIGQRGQVFTSSSTFTVPTGVTAVKVTVIGGGGGGGGGNNATAGAMSGSGTSGGTSSFSSISASGGGGGGGTTGSNMGDGAGGANGTASGSQYTLPSILNNSGSPYGIGGGGGAGSGGGGSGGSSCCAVGYITGLTPASTITVTVGGGGGGGGGLNGGASGSCLLYTSDAADE